VQERQTVSGPWHRIERRSNDGCVLDYVEVGACAGCGRGVDRDVPAEYREDGGALLCAACAGGGDVIGLVRREAYIGPRP
jgi:hypothetical protein